MKYEIGRSPCHYLSTVLDRLEDLNNSLIDPHERALVARANMLAYEITDNNEYLSKAKKIGKEIFSDILTKESYNPNARELKLLYFLYKQQSLNIDENQINRIIKLSDNWSDPDDRICALLLGYNVKMEKDELEDQIYDIIESLPIEERLWPYTSAYIMTNREFELPSTILEIAKQVGIDENPAAYLDKIIWIESLYDPDFGPRNFAARKEIAEEIHSCDEPFDLLFTLGYMRNENVLENIERNIDEVSTALDFAPEVNIPIEARKAPTNDAIVLGRGKSTINKIGCEGTIYLGRVSEKGKHDLYGRKVLVDAVFPHVVFISGHRGSGKSYSLGVIAEELAKADLGVGVILIDPIEIFWALKTANTDQNEKLLLEQWGLRAEDLDNIEVFTPVGIYDDFSDPTIDSPFAIKPSDLHIEDWCNTFDIGRYEVRGTVLEKALKIVQEESDEYSIDDIIDALDDPAITNSYRSNSIRAIRSRMEAAKGWGIFSGEGTPLSRLSSPNKISVLDISNPRIGDSLRALLVGIISRKILEARIRSSRGESFEKSGQETEEEDIPVTWLLIDEAHVLVPSTKKTAASDSLIEYAKQGRKPGCALVLVTQQPSAMHKDIMSQIDLMITHLLTFDDDIKAFLKRVPSSVPDSFEEADFIRSMPTGIGLLSDQRTQNRSLVVKVRPRYTLHAGREAVPKSLRQKMKNHKHPTVPQITERDVIIETPAKEESVELSESTIPEPLPQKDETPEIEKTPIEAHPSKKRKKKPIKKGDFPIPTPSKFPKQMIHSILERKLEYGQNDFLYNGSKSTRFDLHQQSGFREGALEDILSNIVSELETIGWEISKILSDENTAIILMRLDSASLGIAYALVEDKVALSYLIVAKERFRKSKYDKIFDL
ncbi:MAG: ATP-binding protein [Asgard group archaeon]|nr:ATP-binding protein [Asgard group archaeon]